MSNVLLFTPKANLTAKQNLSDFVIMCRDRLTVFGADLDWYNSSWPGVGNFTKKDVPSRGYSSDQLLHPDIMSFAKAYVRYQQGHNPTKLRNEFKALRCIEQGLLNIKGCADITLTDLSVMDEAGRIAQTYDKTAYQAGLALVILLEFLNESGIIVESISWKNPAKKGKEIHRTDDEAKQQRADKMPEPHLLDAMAEMFSNDLLDARDRFTTSMFALCMCAPARITEVQDLPVNCIHEETDNKGVLRLGLRFFGGKGYGSDIKYVSTSFRDIAVEAVRRLSELSAPGRALAKWLENHPDKFYRHANCPNVGEHQPLTNVQACEALGITPGERPRAMVAQAFKGYEPYQALVDRGGSVTLSFINEFVHSRLPKGWPWKNKERHIKYSDALCCFRQNELRADFPPRPILVWTPGKSTFTTDINFIAGQERSIWIRNGYMNPDGSPMNMTSHQIRHYLNTAANLGDMSQLDIAKWSGRANIHQNPVYNHMSEDDYVEQAREVGVGTALAKVRTHSPVTLADLDSVGQGIAHITEFGFCVHDYSMLPCQKNRDCLNCTEQVCLKGWQPKLESLKARQALIKDQLAKAESANDAGVYGADRWSQHQRKTLARADQLIEIMENPDIPEGTVVRLSNDQEFSPLKRALAAQSTDVALASPAKQIAAENADDELDVEELRDLLGAF